MHDTAPTVAGKMPKAEITITLIDAGGDDRPVPCRLKQLLKWALRIFHLRCTAATGLDSTEIQP